MKKDYFDSIEDLPIWNWWKIADSGNLIYMQKLDYYDKEDYSIKAFELWNKVQNEYLEVFGITDEFRQVLALKKKWIKTKTDYLLTGERFKLTEIDIIDAQIKDTTANKIDVDKEDTLIVLEQKLNRELDPKKVSVKKYFKYINHFSKQSNG